MYVLDIDVTRNGNNLKLKVKSEFSFIFVEFILFLYVLDIDVTRNGNNLKLKVKSEFSLSMGLMVIASEASFLVCSMARIFSLYIYIGLYISGRTSCRKCSKCFYVYLNIRPVRYSARIESVDKPVFFSTAKKCSATEDCCRNPGGDRRPSSTVKYCSATGLLPNRQRGERPGVNGLPFSHRRKETPVFNNLELLVNPSSTAKKCSATEDCCRNPGGDRHPSSTVKYCSATGLLPNRQRGERPGVNGLPFSHRRKETPVFNKLQLLVNRRLRQNRRKRNKPVFNS